MAEPLESYSVACSRHHSGCQRCEGEGPECSYSRSGVIRRSRKKKDGERRPPRSSETSAGTEPSGLSRRPRQLPPDSTGTTQERLQRLIGKDHRELGALASLLEEYATVWQGSSAFDKLAEGAEADFFLFEEDQVRPWVEGEWFPWSYVALLMLPPSAFITTLQRQRLLLTSAPPEILDHLAASRPHQVQDRAWLVMFYSIALSAVSSTNPSDEATKAKLRSNLWLAFNDVRLLLEPKISSLQALFMLACHVEEFMTPSVCWVLVTKACVMLQALGISHWRLDSATCERRTLFFWRLNILDKALALILGRPPTFHREMTAATALPTLEQLLPPQPYQLGGAPTLFEAHYTHQMHLLSCVMGNIWHCLYGQGSDDLFAVKGNLESWHRQATEVLEAAALAEKPLLSASGAASVDFGLRTLQFHYLSLLVLLTVSSKQLRKQSTHPSQQMLQLLPSLGEMDLDLQEPYTCLVWQRLHCPLAAFGALWGDTVLKGKTHVEQNQNTPNPNIPTRETPDGRTQGVENLDQQANAFLSPASTTNAWNASSSENPDAQLEGFYTLPNDGFLNTTFDNFFAATFDWSIWDNQEL
ncbi:uncharacterized protein BP5553_05137 [Venustampulla echinocandica]|uniref:Xylanolytic transcriptional activator regulatory domain-containing protein n=1 Tax=Venustampulla echinocandica TaxID=2656787 RepID=A0A370TQA3_9HELO|nr:uncharacterized protein BP5553_05137 [Venustampulla echinocandica]RDL37704.1 hypothetical protein BP5553_05137 [Venustampulla echinocandica]